jgi:tetratricopeptide (TPR) repeat protein
MRSFGYKATTREGDEVVSRIEAASADQARALLADLGFRDYALLDDENSAIKLDDPDSARRLVFTAREEQEFRRTRTFAGQVLWSWNHRENVIFWLPLLVWFAYEVFQGGGLQGRAALPAALLGGFLFWFGWRTLPSLFYARALAASAWCRWDDLEFWMEWLGRWQRWFHLPFPRHELLFRQATAWAGQGQMEEALALVEPLAQDPSLSPGFYESRLASLYFVAHDYARMVQLQYEAYRKNSTDSARIDLATTLVRWVGNPEAARPLLDAIDAEKLNPMAQLFVAFARGVSALSAGDHAKAAELLGKALDLGRASVGSPLMQGMLLDVRAHYGLALAALGDRAAARPHFEAAKPLLEARGDSALLARVTAAE